MLGIKTISPSLECHFRHHSGAPYMVGSPLRAGDTRMYKKWPSPQGARSQAGGWKLTHIQITYYNLVRKVPRQRSVCVNTKEEAILNEWDEPQRNPTQRISSDIS